MTETVGRIGEVALLRRLQALLPPGRAVRVGIGDDTAVVDGGSGLDLLLTSDAVIEGVHATADAPPEALGHKAVARALSDLAAMGGVPKWALVDLVAPPETPVARVEALYRGAAETACRHGLSLVGGDTARGPVLEIHLFAVGEVPTGSAVLRSGARPGDLLYVTGELGGSILGGHLTFNPRLEEGAWLRNGDWAGAMIDLSDGLATDSMHLAEQSHCGVLLDAARIPVSLAAVEIADTHTPLHHALTDGEDYELLFTVEASKAAAFASSWAAKFELPCTRIGVITDGEAALLLREESGEERPLHEAGFDHFGGS